MLPTSVRHIPQVPKGQKKETSSEDVNNTIPAETSLLQDDPGVGV